MNLELGTYQHFKGNFYEALNLSEHSETNECMVTYQSYSNGKIWTRPLSSWVEIVEWPDGIEKEMFHKASKTALKRSVEVDLSINSKTVEELLDLKICTENKIKNLFGIQSLHGCYPTREFFNVRWFLIDDVFYFHNLDDYYAGNDYDSFWKFYISSPEMCEYGGYTLIIAYDDSCYADPVNSAYIVKNSERIYDFKIIKLIEEQHREDKNVEILKAAINKKDIQAPQEDIQVPQEECQDPGLLTRIMDCIWHK